MKKIKHLVEQIQEELHDVEKYAECAMKHKDDDRELANTYHRLAEQELEHAHALHGNVVRVIREHGGDPPPVMKAIWDWEHEKMIEQEKEVKTLLEMFRS